MKYNDAIKIAKGCFDYSGGFTGIDRDIFHQGISTVVNALEGAKKTNMGDLQSKTLHAIGERSCRKCGCTHFNPCTDPDLGNCWWVEEDLCSHCDPETMKTAK